MLKFDKYWKTYKHLIYKVIAQYANQYNFSDVESSVKLGLMQAIRTYDKSKGCCFGTWLFWKIRKEAQNVKNGEYITSCSSVTRKKCPVETKVPYEYADLECIQGNDGSALVNDFFETFPQYISYKRLFYDFYLMEIRKNKLEKKYRIHSRKELNRILALLTSEFKQWYLIEYKGTSRVSSGILEYQEAI